MIFTAKKTNQGKLSCQVRSKQMCLIYYVTSGGSGVVGWVPVMICKIILPKETPQI